MAAGAIKVKGLREFQRACNKSSKEVKTGLKDRLKDAAEPVRDEAARRALSEIRNVGSAWSRMRVGVTARYVYVAPASRRRGGSPRPNLGRLLFTRAMQPALEAKRPEVEREVEQLLDNLIDGF